jgi:hypothetical protein
LSIKLDGLELVKKMQRQAEEPVEEIRTVYGVSVEDKRNVVELNIPGAPYNVLQDMGSEPVMITLVGEIMGQNADQTIESLYTKYNSGAPVEFFSDISSVAEVNKVIMKDFIVQEIAGVTSAYRYKMLLYEYREPKETSEESPESQQQQAEEQVEKETEIDDIRGQVLDADGNPAKGIKVKIKGPKGETEVQTDEEGYYELQDVPEGKYEITPVAGKEEGREGGEEAAAKEEEYTKTEVEIKKGGGSSGSRSESTGESNENEA